MKFWIAVLLPALLFVCTACSDPHIDSVTIEDSRKYMQVNSFVYARLQSDFSGFLISEEQINPSSADYYYHYECAPLGEPSFIVYLVNRFAEYAFFESEHSRICKLALESHNIDEGVILYSAKDSCESVNQYLDEEVLDGLCFYFEFALVDMNNNTISYLTAVAQDNQKKSPILSSFLYEYQCDFKGQPGG